MSISQRVPLKQREDALIRQIRAGEKPLKTGELVDKVIKHFPQLTPLELQRRTPSGTLWWRGCLRFDLDRLKKKGLVFQPAKGYWEAAISGDPGDSQPTRIPASPVKAHLRKKTCSLGREILNSIENQEIKGLVRVGKTQIVVEIGSHIKETEILPLGS